MVSKDRTMLSQCFLREGKKHKGKSQDLKRKLLLQATTEIKTMGWTNGEKLAGRLSTH